MGSEFASEFWSVASMPIGLMTCFLPVLIAWVIAARKPQQQPARETKRP